MAQVAEAEVDWVLWRHKRDLEEALSGMCTESERANYEQRIPLLKQLLALINAGNATPGRAAEE
jgi:hypothetical protein